MNLFQYRTESNSDFDLKRLILFIEKKFKEARLQKKTDKLTIKTENCG